MPQPLKKSPKDLSFMPQDLEKRSRHLSIIVKIINTWSSIETTLCLILALLLKTESQLAADLYFSTASLPLRLDMIKAAAKSNTDKDFYKRISGTMDEVRKVSRRRNSVIHASWGTSSKYPKDLIRLDPMKHTREFSKEIMKIHSFRKMDLDSPLPFPVGDLYPGAARYSEQDMLDILNALHEQSGVVMFLWKDLMEDGLKKVHER